ncbi:hypothetical protein [Deinococcus sp.]|uniref:hypothetical protein n=1 Tax=Deinococcus sp. TaxID=47478 RepID=UPI003C7BA421
MRQRADRLRLVFALISVAALGLTALWSGSVYRRESRHSGDPLPVMTLSQVAHAQTAAGPVHLRDAVPDTRRLVVQEHLCHRIDCIDHFMPLYDAAHPESARVAVLSDIRTFPGDVNEARHPFDLNDPVIEGQVSPDSLFPDKVRDLRAHGVLADDRTVVFTRRALHGTVPAADSVDVLVPWSVGAPVALVSALVALFGLRNGRYTRPEPD